MLKPPEEHATVYSGGDSLFPLEVSGLAFSDRGRNLVDNVSLTLDGRSRTVILGPNGAGKSLLMRLLHGLLQPTAGTILWGGRPLDAAVRARQAMVFQRPTLLRRSAEENLRFVLGHLPRTARDARITELLADAKLTDIRTMPARLLSGGEQQRLAIARARAADPDVLFLDEPSASLDPASTHAIEELIRAIHAEGTKIILVTHDLGQARRLADDVVFVSRGRIMEHQPAADFFLNQRSDAARAYIEGRLDIGTVDQS
ncbi:MAG: ATP-binding cassette domain-containing protein [Hyphomicrobiaceae bacterium]|nr:ATP-binding cassette domain-containing protein [Hyphomicrobiaceae bacterium]